MSKKIVSTDGLRLRTSPNSTDGARSMPLSQEVTVLNTTSDDIFWEVETNLKDQLVRGFASSNFLRQPLSQAKEKLLKIAVDEWIKFDRGTGEEHLDPYYKRVGDYWKSINNTTLDGRNRNQPWSAAFISFIMRAAGYTDFKFYEGHWKYICDAKAKRLANKPNAPFWLFKLNEHKPQLGDLVVFWRKPEGYSDSQLVKTYEGVNNTHFPSHTDVIVELKNDSVVTIGGNVDHSVDTKKLSLTNNGFLKANDKLFAIMRNNL